MDNLEKALEKSRQILIDGIINKEVVNKVRKQILILTSEKPNSPIKLVLNSTGGDIISGFDLFYLLKNVDKLTPVIAEAQGEVSSIALLVLQAARGRKCFSNSRFQLHNFTMTVTGSFDQFMAKAQIEQKKVCMMHLNYCKLIAQRSGMTVAQVKNLCNYQRTLSGQEAKELGLIDEVIK